MGYTEVGRGFVKQIEAICATGRLISEEDVLTLIPSSHLGGK